MLINTSPKGRVIFIAIGLVILGLIISSFFGGRYSNSGVIDDLLEREDSLITESQEKQAVYEETISEKKDEVAQLELIISELEQNNYRLYASIKKKERLNRVRDTSFIRNAVRISDSVNRYSPKDNDPR